VSSHHHCAFTNIEAEAKAVISTAIHPCHFRQSIRFDVGPPFVGQEPLTRSTEELLCWWPVLISGFPLVMVIVQACPRRSRQPAIWHQVTSRISLRINQQVRRLNLWIARRAQVRVINRLAC